jgi:hypothetical protein
MVHGSVSASSDDPVTHTVSTMYQEIRLIDSTGILLAGFVNAGRQYTAREDAMRDPSKWQVQGDKVVVNYSYQPMPILSGLITDARIRLGLGSPELDGMAIDSMSHWYLDLRSEFYTFRPVKSLPMVSSLYLGVTAGEWGDDNISSTFNKLFMIDMPFGASTSYVINENLVATGRVAVGVLSPLFGALSGGGKLNPSAEVELGFRPWQSGGYGVMLSASAEIERQFATDRNIWAPHAGLNVALTFGNQIPKKVRSPDAPTPPAAAGTSMSGQICAGASQSPECLEVNNTAPDPVKILFIACAQATVNAANAAKFDTQPNTCRTAGRGIWKYAHDNAATMDAQQTKSAYVAAAGSYDFAAAGYEIALGKLTAEHCAMVELTYNAVLGPDPSNPVLAAKVSVANDAVSQCRAKFSCTFADGDETCVPK